MTPSRLRSRSGITLVELIITSTVMAVMILTVVPLFNVTSRGYSTLEVSTVLSAGIQEAVTRIQSRLSENKRIFDRTTGADFLTRVTAAVSPAPLTGSLLPNISANASLDPSSGTFVSSNTGNCLLFASVDKPVPLTNIMNSLGVATQVRVDTFILNFYYLAPNATQQIGGIPVRDLWEWHSIPYVDLLGLTSIPDVTLRNNAIAALVAPPNSFTYALDTSTPSVTRAFYQLSAGSPWLNLNSVYNIQKASANTMINVIRGATLGSFTYSISPNTSTSFNHKYTVPVYTVANGNFPSGFEIEIVGPSGTRRVFARFVVAVKGNFKGLMAYEHVMLVAARDLW